MQIQDALELGIVMALHKVGEGAFSLLVPQARPGQVSPKQPQTHLSMEFHNVRPLLGEVE